MICIVNKLIKTIFIIIIKNINIKKEIKKLLF